MTWAVPARRSRLLLAGLVITHLLVISGQVDGGDGGSLLQRMFFALLSPLQHALAAGTTGVAEVWHGYLDLRRVREENRRLHERLDVLELLLQEKQDKVREAERLRSLLGLHESLGLDTLGAQVVSRQGLPWFRSLVVDQGRAAGVRPNAAVLTPSGVVGRVVAVGPSSARVQLLLDRDCRVGALVERSRVTGIVQGQIGLADAGTNVLVMKYVPALADVMPGDVVLTSGLDDIYPKGLLIGRVHAVGGPSGLFREVSVDPAVSFDTLEEVLLLRRPPAGAAPGAGS